MIIRRAKILLDNFQFQTSDIRFDKKILEIGAGLSAAEGEEVIDAEGLLLIPGLIDVHTHGAIGYEASKSDCDFGKWKEYLLHNGITTFFPTLCTLAPEEILDALDNLKGADGINLEGPFLSIAKKGAHDENKIIEVDLELLERIKQQVTITTIAPEFGKNLEEIKAVADMGIKVSLGHSAADYETCQAAFAAGATQVTHIFNAMNPLHHRNPGLVGAAVDNENVFCEVIADGFHLHPALVRMLYHALGADRMLLISDALSATGMPDGEYQSGGLSFTVRDGQARLADGTISGSTSHLMTVLKRAVSFGIPMSDAVKMATLTPARAVGLDSDRGSIQVGKRADLALLAPDFDIKQVFLEGEPAL